MNIKLLRIVAAGMAIAVPALCMAETRLPKVKISGEEYYVYEVKKGDSMYGIANRYGWKVDRLSELNPSQSTKLQKGAKIYYPTGETAPEASEKDSGMAESYPTIEHVVKRGDTVYSLSKIYGVSVSDIYSANPDSKSGIKAGDTIFIPQRASDINDGDSFLYYSIRPGDTLTGVARTYNTSIGKILSDNKGISEKNFKAGDILRIAVNSNSQEKEMASVEETKLAYIDTYKVEKDDTWNSVARKTGMDVAELKEANAGTKLKKDVELAIPVVETSVVEMEVEKKDLREDSSEGRQEIYNEVHSIVDDTLPSGREEVRMALIIEDPASKRDSEFTRGMFLGLDRLKDSPYAINFKVLQDTGSDSESLTKALDDFNAELVVTTYEKNFPLWLAKYGEENGVEIVNSFDVKNEMYLDNPSMIHLLTPSTYFYDEVAEWADGQFDDRTLVMIGKEDSSDGIAESLLQKRDGRTVLRFAIEDIPGIPVTETGRYLIYGYPTSKEEVTQMLEGLQTLKEANPLIDIKVLGRPNWITMTESMGERFSDMDVYFPSRFFFDHSSEEGKAFIADYSSAYGHGPIKSYPTYAVSGYDIVNYFVLELYANDGDFNVTVPAGHELQTPIRIKRTGNWGGFFNPSVYVIRYTPYGSIEKISITQ